VASRFDAARRFTIDERNSVMNTTKTILARRVATLAVAGMLGTVLSVPSANAFTCARGIYRAGCVSPYGAVGWSRNGVVAVGRYGNTYAYHRGSGCFWRNGQRICM
jgi:hypothetical protein